MHALPAGTWVRRGSSEHHGGVVFCKGEEVLQLQCLAGKFFKDARAALSSTGTSASCSVEQSVVFELRFGQWAALIHEAA